MAWSYRKRIKVIPGVHLNFSKKGISTSIGIKGASINFSGSGTTVSTTILGFSNRYQLSNPALHSSPSPAFTLPEVSLNDPALFDENIFSADLHEITSQNMQGIKEAIILARQQKNELSADLNKIKKTLSVTKTKKILSYSLL